MKEINFKSYYYALLIFYAFMMIVGCYFAVYFIKESLNSKNTRDILVGIIMPIFFFLTAKASFFDVMFFLRFYGVKIKLLDDKMILSTNKRYCEIPAVGTYVIYCMFGWLIVWHEENSRKMILLRKSCFLGKDLHELRRYFQQNTNYIPRGEEKKKLLKSFNVNVLNPLKYIKWPENTGVCF